MVGEPLAIRSVGAGEFRELLRFASGLTERRRCEARLFEVLEGLQQSRAETARVAHGSKITIRRNFIFRDLPAKKFQAQSRGATRWWQKIFERAEPDIGMAVRQCPRERTL